MTQKERVEAYIATVERLEPNISAIDASAFYASAAISLKRSADAKINLRDYFAGLAMQAAFAGMGAQQLDRDERYNGTNWAQVVAKNAYEMANAMLEERE